jgi:ribose-phosphate pyrophosphokinase
VDFAASGESILDLARELKKRNAARIYAAVTFPLFTNGLDEYNEAYEDGIITRVISTNLTYCTPELKAAPWYLQADMSKYISYIVASLRTCHALNTIWPPTSSGVLSICPDACASMAATSKYGFVSAPIPRFCSA